VPAELRGADVTERMRAEQDERDEKLRQRRLAARRAAGTAVTGEA
jgi:hypothetical protein